MSTGLQACQYNAVQLFSVVALTALEAPALTFSNCACRLTRLNCGCFAKVGHAARILEQVEFSVHISVSPAAWFKGSQRQSVGLRYISFWC